MNGPRPGLAKTPTPASHPRTPPTTPPAVAPGCRPLWKLRVFLDGKILGPLVLGKQNRHIGISKALGPEGIYRKFDVGLRLIDPKYRSVFPRHKKSP